MAIAESVKVLTLHNVVLHYAKFDMMNSIRGDLLGILGKDVYNKRLLKSEELKEIQEMVSDLVQKLETQSEF